MTERKAKKRGQRIAVENSFASVAAQWLEHWQDGKSPRHVDSTKRRLASNIPPSLGALQVIKIEAPEVEAMVRLIGSRGARDVAKRALETTGQIFRFAIAYGFAKRTQRPRSALVTSSSHRQGQLRTYKEQELLRQLEVYPGRHITGSGLEGAET